jgi:uncharacterized membrane protein
METLISAGQSWLLLALIVSGAALSISLEQRFSWGARLSGPVLALLIAMLLTGFHITPVESPTYDMVDGYLVPLAIPLLLFRANVRRIFRETGRMLACFHVAAFGTLVGAILATFLFHGLVPKTPDIVGVMTGSYIGGGVNFMAVKTSFGLESNLANPLIVADNFIMAGMFVMLLILSGSRFLLRRFPLCQTALAPSGNSGTQASRFWKRKEVSLLDLAQALAVAFIITALSMSIADLMQSTFPSGLAQAFLGNAFVWITFLTMTAATLAHRWLDKIQGAEEIGTFLLYLFFFVIGLRADLGEVLFKVPALFGLCLAMALTNLVVTLLVGRLLRLPLEELLLSVNATLGGAPSAAAMAISKGWTGLVLPGLLVGIWGYVIGTFLGVLTGQILRQWF